MKRYKAEVAAETVVDSIIVRGTAALNRIILAVDEEEACKYQIIGGMVREARERENTWLTINREATTDELSMKPPVSTEPAAANLLD